MFVSQAFDRIRCLMTFWRFWYQIHQKHIKSSPISFLHSSKSTHQLDEKVMVARTPRRIHSVSRRKILRPPSLMSVIQLPFSCDNVVTGITVDVVATSTDQPLPSVSRFLSSVNTDLHQKHNIDTSNSYTTWYMAQLTTSLPNQLTTLSLPSPNKSYQNCRSFYSLRSNPGLLPPSRNRTKKFPPEIPTSVINIRNLPHNSYNELHVRRFATTPVIAKSRKLARPTSTHSADVSTLKRVIPELISIAQVSQPTPSIHLMQSNRPVVHSTRYASPVLSDIRTTVNPLIFNMSLPGLSTVPSSILPELSTVPFSTLPELSTVPSLTQRGLLTVPSVTQPANDYFLENGQNHDASYFSEAADLTCIDGSPRLNEFEFDTAFDSLFISQVTPNAFIDHSTILFNNNSFGSPHDLLSATMEQPRNSNIHLPVPQRKQVRFMSPLISSVHLISPRPFTKPGNRTFLASPAMFGTRSVQPADDDENDVVDVDKDFEKTELEHQNMDQAVNTGLADLGLRTSTTGLISNDLAYFEAADIIVDPNYIPLPDNVLVDSQPLDDRVDATWKILFSRYSRAANQLTSAYN